MTKLIKTAVALAVGASIVTTAVVPADASATAKYKVKNNKLVVVKTGKAASGTITFNKIVYKNGVKLTGLKGSVYYKNGKKGTGTYKGAYYVSGAKKITTGTYNKAYYVKGVKKVTTGVYASKYYKSGKLATATYKGTYYVNGIKKVTTGTYNKAYYVKGVKKVTTGTYNKAYYVNGVEKVTTGTFEGVYYVDGFKAIETGLLEGKLYVNGVLSSGYALYDSKLYKDADLNVGFATFEDKVYKDAVLAEGTLEYNGQEEAFEKGVKVGAKVASVQAINGTTVEVKFNKAVSKVAVTAADVVTIEGVILTNPMLSEDGRTLTLTAADAKSSDKAIVLEDATVTVNRIATKADAKVLTPKYVNVLNFKDTEAPTALSATSELAKVTDTTAKTVTIKFSEAVKLEGIFYVNGSAVSATQNKEKNELVLDITSLNVQAGESVEVKMTNVKDIAGNDITPNPVTITTTVQAANTVAPVIESVKTIDDDTVVVTYSKEIDTASTTAYLSDGTKQIGSTTTSATVNPENKKEVIYTFAALTLVEDKLTATLVIPKEAVVDTKGNKFAAEYTTSVTFANDTVLPTVTTSSFKDGELTINFSEEVAVNSSNAVFTLVNSATGSAVEVGKIGLTNADLSEDKKSVTVKTAALKLAEGTYKVALAEGFVEDISKKANKVAAFETTINVAAATVEEKEDKVAPELGAITDLSKDYQIQFTIADELNNIDFVSILDKNNYTFAGKALPVGTTVTTNSTTTDTKTTVVTITVPKTAFATATTGKFTITGIKDVKGNAISEIVASKEVTFKDGVAPTVKTAFAIVDNTPVLADLSKGLEFKLATGSTTTSITINFDEVVNLNDAEKVFVKVGKDAAVEYGTIKLATDGKSAVITPTTAGHGTMGTEDAVFTLVKSDGTTLVTSVKDTEGNELTIPAISVKVAK